MKNLLLGIKIVVAAVIGFFLLRIMFATLLGLGKIIGVVLLLLVGGYVVYKQIKK